VGVLTGTSPWPEGWQEGSAHPRGFGSHSFTPAGAEQTKLVCELVEECLEPDYVRMVLG